MGPGRRLFVHLCVGSAAVAGGVVSTSVAHGQILLVSRQSQLITTSHSSQPADVPVVQNLTDWAQLNSGTLYSYERLGVGRSFITIDSQANGMLDTIGVHNPTTYRYSSSVETLLTFDVVSPGSYTLAGMLGMGFCTATLDFRLEGAPTPIYTNAAPTFSAVNFSTIGELTPGRYALHVLVSAPAVGIRPVAQANISFSVTPAPGAAALFAAAGVPLGLRRRRGS